MKSEKSTAVNSLRNLLALLLLIVLFVCCKTESANFKIASKENTAEAYLNFLNRYPNGRYAEPAESCYIRGRIIKIYKDVSRDSLGDIGKMVSTALKSDNIIEEQRRLFEEHQRVIDDFNGVTAILVKRDKYLAKYFNGLIQKAKSGESNPTLETLNYYGIDVRLILIEDFNVDILDR